MPLIIAAPQKPASHGVVSLALMELVDVRQPHIFSCSLALLLTCCTRLVFRMHTDLPDNGGARRPSETSDRLRWLPCLEGDSAVPLLDSPHMDWKTGVFSQYARCRNADTASTGYYQRCSGQQLETLTAMGYSIRTKSWRYTEWFPFNDTALVPEMGTTLARELYDHTVHVGDDMDFPGAASDLLNVAEDPVHAATVKEMAAMVREGWKGQRPQLQLV